jgi:hypothetical protein
MMTPDSKKKFDVWYEANRLQAFILPEALASYCMNDVEILTHAVVELKRLFEETTGVDIVECNTIASACMKTFRLNLHDDKSLALVSEKGYGRDKNFRQSDIARKWLKWFGHVNNVEVEDNESNGYEKRVGPYYVDGFVRRESEESDLVLEVHGCFYHGCSVHYPDDQTPLLGNRTAGQIRERNRIREEHLKIVGQIEGFELEIKWEW